MSLQTLGQKNKPWMLLASTAHNELPSFIQEKWEGRYSFGRTEKKSLKSFSMFCDFRWETLAEKGHTEGECQSLAMPRRVHSWTSLWGHCSLWPSMAMAPNRYQVHLLYLTKSQGTKFARFIIFMVKWQRLRKSSKWSIISHIGSKEYWLTSGDSTLPLLSFSSTLFLRLCSWSFSFRRSWTCSNIFIFSSAVLLWSCTFFSDNSWSTTFRRVDIFKLSVFKA